MKKLSLMILLFISAAAFGQQAENKVNIYNVQADAANDIKLAVAKAAKENKHVLIQVGGNWCTWCIAFHNLVHATPELSSYLDKNYVTVLVNYSPENKNEKVLANLNFPQRFGFPVFVVLDGKGKLIHTENSAYLETEAVDEKGKKLLGHDVKKVLNFLKSWTVAAVDPKTYASEK